MITWQDATTPDELMELLELKEYKTVDKWSAFRYWANSKKEDEHQFFLKLLYSPHYTAEEILTRFGGQIDYFRNKQSVEAIYEKLLSCYNNGDEECKRKIEQAPYCWRLIKDVKTLIRVVDGYEGGNLGRWQVFRYYASSLKKEDEEFFKILLEERFVTTEAIERSFNATNAKSVWQNAHNLELARQYVVKDLEALYECIKSQEPKDKDKYFQNLEIEKLAKTPFGRKKLKAHLDFFASFHEENFYNLISRVPFNLIRDWYFVGEKTEQSEKICKMITENRPEILLGVKVCNLKDKMDWDLELRKALRQKDAFNDWDLFYSLATTKNANYALYNFLSLDVVTPERIMEKYSAEQLENFNSEVKLFMQEDAWKHFNDPWFVARRINDDNKWEVIKYYLENDYRTAKHLVKDFEIYGLTKLANNFKGLDTSLMPEESKAFVTKVIKQSDQLTLRNQLKKEETQRLKEDEELQRALRWQDKETGKLKVFFTLFGGRKVASCDEYRMIAEEFIRSNLTVKAFARKYKISSSEGLLKMLHLVSTENEEYAQVFNERMLANQKHFYESTKSLVEAVVFNKITVEEFMNKINPNSHSLENMVNFINSTYKNPKVGAIFIHRIISYYYDRLNAYQNTTCVSDINTLLTKREVLFIVGNKQMLDMKREGKIQLEDVVYSSIKGYEPYLKALFQNKVNGYSKDKVRNKIKIYNELYNPNKFNGMVIGTINKGEIKVDEKVLDSLEAYALEHDLFLSEVSATKILCSMAEGKINVKPEQKKKVVNIASLINATNLNEYFMMINNQEEQLEC